MSNIIINGIEQRRKRGRDERRRTARTRGGAEQWMTDSF